MDLNERYRQLRTYDLEGQQIALQLCREGYEDVVTIAALFAEDHFVATAHSTWMGKWILVTNTPLPSADRTLSDRIIEAAKRGDYPAALQAGREELSMLRDDFNRIQLWRVNWKSQTATPAR